MRDDRMTNARQTQITPVNAGMTNVGISYLLWIVGIFGLSGLHRLYNRKPVTGILWLSTLGLLGIGQFIDLFLIPNMVDEHNLKQRARLGYSPAGVLNPAIHLTITTEALAAAQSQAPQAVEPLTREQIMLKLLKAAEARGGRLSVTQGVLDTGLGFAEIEQTLHEMVKTGYVAIENHPATGVIVYNFLEL